MKNPRFVPLFTLAFGSFLLALPSIPKAIARPVVPIKKTAPANRQKFDTTRFVPESELRNGQMGYALTVFQGTRIDRFGVKILGVLSKVNNGKDLILIRVTSGPSVTRGADIAAGMSGSPVYIGKRMVGAIAYSLAFAKEPIGLVTPIGDMLDAWDPDLPAKPSLALAATAADAIPMPMSPAITVPNSEIAPLVGQIGAMNHETADNAMTFEPVMTPVMVSGMNPQGIARLASILGPLHLMPMAGGGPPAHVTAEERKDAQLVPGAAVGVSLVQGDIDETAIGTLTYRDGNRVVAFGHPFTGIGPIDAALTTASITDLFPSYQDSTKLGSPLETVGRIFQDRPYSVGGIIGSMPHMVPVTVTIHDESDNRTEYFHARVINHPLLTGPLISQVADQAILQAHGTPGDAIAMVTTDISAEQVGHIVRSNIFYDPLSIDQTATGDLDAAMRLLSSNPFYPLAVKSVTMNVTIETKHPTAQIDHIILPKATYAPGDTVDVGIVLKPYRREPTLVKIPLTIPTTAPDGPITVMVRGGATAGANTISLGGGLVVIKPAIPVGPPAANITQLVHQYLEEPHNNDLVASLQLPTTALDIQGEKLSLLPPTMSAIMRAEHSSGLKLERDEVKKTETMGWIISGQQSLTINVARKNVTDQASATTSTSDSTTATTDTTQTASTDGDDDSSDDSSDASTADSSSDDSSDDSMATAPSLSPMALLIQKLSVIDGLQEDAVVKHSGSTSPVSPSMQTTTSSTTSATTTSATTTTTTDAAAAKPTPVGRLATIWRQDSQSAFQEGKLENVTISSQNDLRLSASLSETASSTAPYIWALAADKQGNLFAGTGDDGVVYKLTGSKLSDYYHTGEIEASSLAYDSQTGDLYIGTSPRGAIFKVTPDGKGNKIFSTAEKYVSALAIDPKSCRLYAATSGGQGKVYAIPLAAPSTGKALFSSTEAHLQSLAVGPDGQVYAGGSPDGLVYSITSDGKARILYDAAEPNISCLGVDSSGTVYAGTSPRGVIYKIVPSTTGSAPTVTKLTQGTYTSIYGLCVDPSGAVWACSGNNILRIPQDGTVLTHTAATDVSFISLALGQNGQVFAGTSNVGAVYTLGSSASGPTENGTYTSPVHDAKLPAQWGTIAWQASTPAGSAIQLETRSGDVAQPDATWSAWSVSYTTATGEAITSPSARFIQYRATLSGNATGDPSALPRLQSVAIYYLTRNQPPTVKVTSPSGGDSVSGAVTLRWTGSDPDKDTLSYSVLYSADGGKTWQPLKKALQVSQPTVPSATTATVASSIKTSGTSAPSDADVAKALAEFKKQLDQQPDIPPAVRAQMLQQAPDVIRQALALKQSPGAMVSVSRATDSDSAHVSATSYKWNTKDVPDGTYQIKVIASDAPSNPTGSLTAESTSSSFVVDNTPPTVAIDSTRTAIDQQKHTAQLYGVATTALSFVEAVQYRLDKTQDWTAAAPDSGLFDSRTAPFTIDTSALSVGAHTITVQAIDQAGNTAQATANFVIP